MSDYVDKQRLRQYLETLEKQSLPNSNDERHAQYIKYVTAILRHFGKEMVLLAGSTGENLKLRFSKDGGDADIVFCSGKLEIPVADLKFRDDMPCFTWVRVSKNDISENITLMDDTYLPGDILRRVDPELFTILRGVYLIVTSTSSYVPGRESLVTTTGIESRVGLAREEYRNLKPGEDILPSRRHNYKNRVLKRDEEFKQYLNRKRQKTPTNKKDVEGMDTILRLILTSITTKGPREGGGQWQHFSDVVKLAVKRRKTEDAETDSISFVNDLDSPDEKEGDQNPSSVKRKHSVEIEPDRKVRATYEEKTSKDYVPAMRIVGIIPCMHEWRRAEHRWLSEEVINDIFNMDVLIVARFAPVNPSRKDFCLSFTMAEKKLAECLSRTQRQLVLVMKAYLKGLFTKRHKEAGIRREVKLKTFHIKTIIYRVLDVTDQAVWPAGDVYGGILKVLRYLETVLEKKELLHYFVASNLFAGFEDEDYTLLLSCTREIIKDPIESIKPFFDLDDGLPVETWLMEEEMLCLEKMTDDGGLSQEVDRLEEALIEFQRGFNEGPRDEQGNAPIRAAVATLTQLFLEDEITKKRHEVEENQQVLPGLSQEIAPLSSAISGMIANIEGEDLGNTIVQFIGNSSRDREPNPQLENELKYKFMSYFIGRK